MPRATWPGVTGSTNNTFHINGAPLSTRTSAFDANVLQVETIAQSAERGGLKVAQVEWAGGRNASIQGPTIDFQSFLSGRGVATNFIGGSGRGPFDDAPSSPASGSSSTIRPAYASSAPFPGRTDGGDEAGQAPSLLPTVPPWRCASASSISAPTSTV